MERFLATDGDATIAVNEQVIAEKLVKDSGAIIDSE